MSHQAQLSPNLHLRLRDDHEASKSWSLPPGGNFTGIVPTRSGVTVWGLYYARIRNLGAWLAYPKLSSDCQSCMQ